MWDNILLIPNDLALFFLGLCLVMPIIPIFLSQLRENRTYNVWTFWAYFAGTPVWFLMTIIGWVKYGVSGMWIPLLITLAMGYEAYKYNRDNKKLAKK